MEQNYYKLESSWSKVQEGLSSKQDEEDFEAMAIIFKRDNLVRDFFQRVCEEEEERHRKGNISVCVIS